MQSMLHTPLKDLTLSDIFMNPLYLWDVESLIFHGDQDPIIPLENSQRIHELKPNYALEIFRGVDHSFRATAAKQLELALPFFHD